MLLGGLLLCCSSEITAQITSYEEVYKELDFFLASPTPSNADTFEISIKQYHPDDTNGLLAKVIALCNLGYYQDRFLHLPNAIKSYEAAKKLYLDHSLSDYDMLNFCYKPLGTLYTKVNALSEAEHIIKEYILLAQAQGRKKEEVSGLLNLSVVFHNRGNFKQGIAILTQALELSPNNPTIQLNLASNYLSIGAIDLSEELVQNILLGDDSNSAAHQLWGRIQLQDGKPEAALHSLHKVLELYNDDTSNTSIRELSKLRLALAQTELIIGNTEAAKLELIELFQLLIPSFAKEQNVPMTEQLLPENTLIDALDLQAEVLKKRGDLFGAYVAYLRAFEVSDLLNTAALLQDSKLVQQTNQKNRSERSLELLFDLYKVKKDSFWLREALQIDHNSKSPILQEARKWQQRVLEQSENSTDLRDSIKNIQRELAALHTEMTAVQEKGLDGVKLQVLQSNYTSVIVRQRSLYEEFNQSFPNLDIERPISVAQLFNQLDENETVVSYFVGERSIFQFIVDHHKISFHKLTKNETETAALLDKCASFSHFFDSASGIANNPLLFAKQGYDLYQELQVPISDKLVVVPDGILSFLPFDSLLTTASETISFDQMPFLIKETEVSYRLSLIEHIKVKEKGDKEDQVLGIFPVFSNSERELSYSLTEAEGLQNTFSGSFLKYEAATAEQFLMAASNFDIIHISTHARAGTFSNPAAIEFADRMLTVNELYGYQFDKDLVVLSACETGVGKIIKGDGAQSMARAFQYTGAQNVLFSLWKVNDLSTSWLMTQFYKEYAQNLSKSESLHRAKLSYLENSSINDVKKSPYFWASFVYYGESEIPESPFPWRWFFGIIVGCCLGVFFLRKNIGR